MVFLWAVMALILWPALATGRSQTHPPPPPPPPSQAGDAPLVLAGEQESHLLGPHLHMLEDPSGSLDISEVASPRLAKRFRALHSATINRGACSSAYWFRFTVVEKTGAKSWFLDVGQPALAFVSLYTPRPPGQGGGWRKLPTLSRNLRHFPPPSRFAVFRLPLEPGRPRTFYLRLQSTSLTMLAPHLESLKGFLDHNRNFLLLIGAYCGTILSLAFYNLVVFFSLRDRSYLWYVLATLSMALYYLGWNGLVQDYLPDIPIALNRHLPIAFLSSLFICRGLFARHFLLTKEKAPLLDRVIIFSALLSASIAILVPLSSGPWRLWSIRVISLTSMGWPVLLMWAAFWRWRQGFRPSGYFLLAYSVTAVGEVIYLLLMVGVMPFTNIFFAAHQIGGTFEAILLSFALGYRIKSLQQDKLGAEHAARESEMRHQLVMESAPYPLAVCDVEGRLTYLNPAFRRVFGWSPAEAEGKTIEAVLASEGLWGGQVGRELLAGREVKGVETRCRTRQGRELDVSLSAAVFRDLGGEAQGLVLILQDISERKRSEAELDEYQRQLRKLALELSKAEERQRRRIAEDLHDGVSQFLATSSFSLKRLRADLRGRARDELARICGVLDQSLADIRSLTFEISPPVLYDYGLAAALDWLAGHVAQRHGLPVDFRSEGPVEELDQDRQVSLYRACQELLVNVVKHARASHAWITLSRRQGHAVLSVADDGRGFDQTGPKKRSGGFGLFSIRERLEPLGGELAVESQPGRGTRVTLSLPLGQGGQGA